VLNEELKMGTNFDNPWLISKGFVRKLEISIPWSRITGRAVQININGLELTISALHKQSNDHAHSRETHKTQIRHSTIHRPHSKSLDHEGHMLSADENLETESDHHETDDGTNPSTSSSKPKKETHIMDWTLAPILMRVAANVNVCITQLKVRLEDQLAKYGVEMTVDSIQSHACDPNWHAIPWMEFITPWKLWHRIVRIENMSIYLDCLKPEMPEEPLLQQMSVEIRMRGYLHALLLGEMPSDQNNTSNTQSENTKKKTFIICHFGNPIYFIWIIRSFDTFD